MLYKLYGYFLNLYIFAHLQSKKQIKNNLYFVGQYGYILWVTLYFLVWKFFFDLINLKGCSLYV